MSDVFSASLRDPHRAADAAVVSGHTPGPWHIGNGDIFADGDARSDFDDRIICAIGKSGGFRSAEYATIPAHRPEGIANARLIAAAPDLLEALLLHEAYLNLPQDRGGPTGKKGRAHQAWLDAKAKAIAKANPLSDKLGGADA